MYDTVYFWFDWAMVGGNPFTIAQYLADPSEHKSARGYSISGWVGNYRVFCNESGILLQGSLAKYHLGDNIHTLTRSGAREAIQKLSDELHLPIDRAKVTRVDVSTVLPMSRPPNEYLPFLGEKSRFVRVQATNDTLYYNTDKMQLVFYDKKKEAKKNRVEIPIGLVDANMLRYEVRFLNRLPKQFNMAEITGATLCNDEKFYTDAIQLWANMYHSINKLKSVSIMDTSNIKTVGDVKDMALSMYLQEKGQPFIDAIIAELKAKNTFKYPRDYTRVKSDFNKLIVASTATEQSELIKELDKAVNEVVLNCR